MTKKHGSGRTKGANRKTSAGGRYVAYTSLSAEDKARIKAFGQETAQEEIVPKTSTLIAILVRKGLSAWEREKSAAA